MAKPYPSEEGTSSLSHCSSILSLAISLLLLPLGLLCSALVTHSLQPLFGSQGPSQAAHYLAPTLALLLPDAAVPMANGLAGHTRVLGYSRGTWAIIVNWSASLMIVRLVGYWSDALGYELGSAVGWMLGGGVGATMAFVGGVVSPRLRPV